MAIKNIKSKFMSQEGRRRILKGFNTAFREERTPAYVVTLPKQLHGVAGPVINKAFGKYEAKGRGSRTDAASKELELIYTDKDYRDSKLKNPEHMPTKHGIVMDYRQGLPLKYAKNVSYYVRNRDVYER